MYFYFIISYLLLLKVLVLGSVSVCRVTDRYIWCREQDLTNKRSEIVSEIVIFLGAILFTVSIWSIHCTFVKFYRVYDDG